MCFALAFRHLMQTVPLSTDFLFLKIIAFIKCVVSSEFLEMKSQKWCYNLSQFNSRWTWIKASLNTLERWLQQQIRYSLWSTKDIGLSRFYPLTSNYKVIILASTNGLQATIPLSKFKQYPWSLSVSLFLLTNNTLQPNLSLPSVQMETCGIRVLILCPW